MNPIFIININFQREYIDMKREILRRSWTSDLRTHRRCYISRLFHLAHTQTH